MESVAFPGIEPCPFRKGPFLPALVLLRSNTDRQQYLHLLRGGEPDGLADLFGALFTPEHAVQPYGRIAETGDGQEDVLDCCGGVFNLERVSILRRRFRFGVDDRGNERRCGSDEGLSREGGLYLRKPVWFVNDDISLNSIQGCCLGLQSKLPVVTEP